MLAGSDEGHVRKCDHLGWTWEEEEADMCDGSAACSAAGILKPGSVSDCCLCHAVCMIAGLSSLRAPSEGNTGLDLLYTAHH